MLLLIVVEKIVGCTALNLSLPDSPLLAGFNSDSFVCSGTDDKQNNWQDEKQMMEKLKSVWFLKQLWSKSAKVSSIFNKLLLSPVIKGLKLLKGEGRQGSQWFFSNPEPLEHGKCKIALFG